MTKLTKDHRESIASAVNARTHIPAEREAEVAARNAVVAELRRVLAEIPPEDVAVLERHGCMTDLDFTVVVADPANPTDRRSMVTVRPCAVAGEWKWGRPTGHPNILRVPVSWYHRVDSISSEFRPPPDAIPALWPLAVAYRDAVAAHEKARRETAQRVERVLSRLRTVEQAEEVFPGVAAKAAATVPRREVVDTAAARAELAFIVGRVEVTP